MPASVAFYVSGHGFGHASRQIAIINALTRRHPDVGVTVRTSAPTWLFDRTLEQRADVHHVPCDTGIVQVDSLRLDAAASVARAARFHDDLERRASEEARWLSAHGAALVVTDAPPLACVAAHRAGIPSMVAANFTWDWIYAGYGSSVEGATDVAARLGQAYALAAGGWRMPMWGGFETIDSVTDVPFVARRSRHPPAAIRRHFGLPADRPLALLSFGGYGLRDLEAREIDTGSVGLVTTTSRDHDLATRTAGATVACIEETSMYEAGYRYEDLVAAVDIVVSKPGYGIIAECVANDTALLYTSRGWFVEYDVLVREMPKHLPCRFIDRSDLLAGRWRAHLESLAGVTAPGPRPRVDGADVVADAILERVAETPRDPS